MIVRDSYSIIVQHDPNVPTYADGGDSARGVGLMAMAGSKLDQELLPVFMTADGPVRHPYQPPHFTNPKNFSRDQLICYMAGLKAAGLTEIAATIFKKLAKRAFFCFNTKDTFNNTPVFPDILLPHTIVGLGLAAKSTTALILAPLMYPLVLTDMAYFIIFRKDEESNQSIALYSLYGRPFVKLFNLLHPHLHDNIMSYFSGWRSQPEIGEAIIRYVEQK